MPPRPAAPQLRRPGHRHVHSHSPDSQSCTSAALALSLLRRRCLLYAANQGTSTRRPSSSSRQPRDHTVQHRGLGNVGCRMLRVSWAGRGEVTASLLHVFWGSSIASVLIPTHQTTTTHTTQSSKERREPTATEPKNGRVGGHGARDDAHAGRSSSGDTTRPPREWHVLVLVLVLLPRTGTANGHWLNARHSASATAHARP